jgi:hypothetical protein
MGPSTELARKHSMKRRRRRRRCAWGVCLCRFAIFEPMEQKLFEFRVMGCLWKLILGEKKMVS